MQDQPAFDLGIASLSVADEPPITLIHLGADAFAAVVQALHDGDLLAFSLTCVEFSHYASDEKFTRKSLITDGTPVSSCLVSVPRLRWALESLSVPWLLKRHSAVCARAAAVGNLSVLKHLREVLDYPWGELTCAEAAAHGHLEVLRWAREQECPWSEASTARAARHGHLHIIEYVHEQYRAGETNGREPWNARTCGDAAEGGHIAILDYLRQQGCAWDADVAWRASRGGHIDLLKWCRAQQPPVPMDGRACEHAAKANNLDMLRWLRENGCEWSHTTCTAAAGQGHLKVLEYARAQLPPCSWIAATCAAASGGHLECLQWLHEHGCPWTVGVSLAAAKSGHLEMLRWAAEHGCPVSRNVVQSAALTGQLPCLRWLRERFRRQAWWPDQKSLTSWAKEWPAILTWIAEVAAAEAAEAAEAAADASAVQAGEQTTTAGGAPAPAPPQPLD